LDDAAQGSAIAVGPTTLLTNCHTLKGHSVHLIAREEIDDPIPVWIKAADYSGDRCVLQTRNRLPSYVEIKPYDTIDIGEDAYSIGTPQDFDLTIANGIVSGKRDMKGIRYLQTTAPISGGSSGGGLFDCAGRLMGITTFYVDGQNLNFAIAADEFR
jgi:S1-C subfamily serine protease